MNYRVPRSYLRSDYTPPPRRRPYAGVPVDDMSGEEMLMSRQFDPTISDIDRGVHPIDAEGDRPVFDRTARNLPREDGSIPEAQDASGLINDWASAGGDDLQPFPEVDAEGDDVDMELPAFEIDASPRSDLDDAVDPERTSANPQRTKQISPNGAYGAQDEGLQRALGASEDAYNGRRVGRFFSALFDPEGDPARKADQNAAAMAPIELFRSERERDDKLGLQKSTQRLAQERLQQQRDIAARSAANTSRGLDMRERDMDPSSDWNRRRANETNAQWAARFAAQGAEHDRQVEHDAPFKGKNAALASGSPASLRAAGIRPTEGAGTYGPIRNAPDAIAQAVMMSFENDGVPPPPEVQAIVNQLSDPNLDNQTRTQLRGALKDASSAWRARNEEAAQQYGNAINQSNIAPIRSQLAAIKNAIGSDDDIPGVGLDNTIATLGGPLGERLISERARSIRAMVERLGDMELRDATGAAAPVSEVKEFKRIGQRGTFDNDDDFRNAISALEDYFDRYERTFEQTFGPQAAALYRARANRNAPRQAPPRARAAGRTVTSRRRNPRTGQILTVYSDGTKEISDGAP